jgi:hypothetical protein
MPLVQFDVPFTTSICLCHLMYDQLTMLTTVTLRDNMQVDTGRFACTHCVCPVAWEVVEVGEAGCASHVTQQVWAAAWVPPLACGLQAVYQDTYMQPHFMLEVRKFLGQQ